jgi:hypothetical protein
MAPNRRPANRALHVLPESMRRPVIGSLKDTWRSVLRRENAEAPRSLGKRFSATIRRVLMGHAELDSPLFFHHFRVEAQMATA